MMRWIVKAEAEPGKHSLVVGSPMRNGFAGTDVTLEVDLEPCRRCYSNAQIKSGLGTE